MNERLKKCLRWKYISGAICLTIFAAIFLVWIFSGDGRWEASEGPGREGPEQVLSGFYSALVTGETDDLKMYCDTASSVMEYIEAFMERASALQEKDGGALSIVADMIKVEVTGEKKAADGLDVRFRLFLDAGDGMSKERRAEMVQEEGRWKIIGIAAE